MVHLWFTDGGIADNVRMDASVLILDDLVIEWFKAQPEFDGFELTVCPQLRKMSSAADTALLPRRLTRTAGAEDQRIEARMKRHVVRDRNRSTSAASFPTGAAGDGLPGVGGVSAVGVDDS